MRKTKTKTRTRCNLAWLAGLCLLAACYNPSYTSAVYRCDVDGSVCPPGFVCAPASGMCVSAAAIDLAVAPDLAMSMPQPDLAMKAPADMYKLPADMYKLPADMYKLPADMVVIPPDMLSQCTQVSSNTDVLACPGKFTDMPSAMALCPTMGTTPPTYHLCGSGPNSNADDGNLGSIVKDTCTGLTGFFAAAFPVSLKNGNNDFQCMAAGPGDNANVLVGCGMDQHTLAASGCHNLPVALICDKTDNGWSCPNSFDMSTMHSGSTGGVLCCHM